MNCGLAFGARLCMRGHRNPMRPAGRYCVECGSLDFTEGTKYVSIDWIGTALAWLTVLASAWIAITHPGLLLTMLVTLLNTLIRLAPRCLVETSAMLLGYAMAIACFVIATPGITGRNLRRHSVSALRLFWRTVVFVVRVLHRLVHGVRRQER